MATVTHICTLDLIAKMLGEGPERLEAIVYNDDNLIYGSVISVYMGPDKPTTALTDGGIEELRDMLGTLASRPQSWHQFLDDVVVDPNLAARIKAQSPQ